jgi:transaldolase / glucose-6-phosphate isomerase
LLFYGKEKANSAEKYLRTFFTKARFSDYIAVQAFLPETPDITQSLETIRLRLRDGLRLATTLGYGPRFLHSTGQFHKGGPNTGLFLQLIAEDAEDVPIPGAPYTFGLFKQAQALGDLAALRRHRRRVMRIHLGADVTRGLESLLEAVDAALKKS